MADSAYRVSPREADPDKYADDLAALIDHLELDDVRLVAQSMGGWTALGYALRNPERVRALVMADTTGMFTTPEIDRLRVENEARHPRPQYMARGVHPAAGERMAREQPAMHFLFRQVDSLSVTLDKDIVRRRMMAMRTDISAELARLTMPVLCITGAEDIVLPTEASDIFAARLADARVARSKPGTRSTGSGPRPSNRAIDDFLSEVEARGSAPGGGGPVDWWG
ncbi:MAG: alpha/beta hydrolase [Dehalococcoidia bacterium]